MMGLLSLLSIEDVTSMTVEHLTVENRYWETIKVDLPLQNGPQFIVSLALAAHCFLEII